MFYMHYEVAVTFHSHKSFWHREMVQCKEWIWLYQQVSCSGNENKLNFFIRE